MLPSTQLEVQPQDSDPAENQYNIYLKKARVFRNVAVIGASVGSLLTIYGFGLISRQDKTVTDACGTNHIVAGGPAGGGFVLLGLSAGIPLTIIGIRKSRKYKREAARIRLTN